jgi:hypothetical protein
MSKTSTNPNENSVVEMSTLCMKDDAISKLKRNIESLENTPPMFRNAKNLEMLESAKKLLVLLEEAPV